MSFAHQMQSPPLLGSAGNFRMSEPAQAYGDKQGNSPPFTTASNSPVNKGLVRLEETELNTRKVEAELEAERLWWSEASERQVKELESQFGEEFQKTTNRLRQDISAVQDRLEMMVEAEKKQRQAALAELRRELDTQQVRLMDVGKQQTSIKSLEHDIAELRSNASEERVLQVNKKVNDAHQIISQLQTDLDKSVTSREAQHNQVVSDCERHTVQLQTTEAALQDLRRSLAGTQDHSSQLEAALQELRQEMNSLVTTAKLQAQSTDEVQALHQVIMQSASDLGQGIEEVSAAVMATERKLRLEMQETRSELEKADNRQCKEILEALEASAEKLAESVARAERGVADEREKRSLEANVFRTQLTAWGEQLEDLQALTKKVQSAPAAPAEDETAQRQKFRAEVESLQSRCTHLEASLNETARKDSVATEMRRAEELVASADDRARRLEQLTTRLEGRLEDELAEERTARSAEMADIRRYAEDMAKRTHLVDSAKGTLPDQAHVPTSSVDIEELRSELSARVGRLEASLQAVDGEARRANSAAARAEADARGLEAETRKYVGLVSKIEALESEVRQAARASEVRHLETEVRRVATDFVPLVSRMDTTEAESRKAVREVSTLTARLVVAESELQRIVRDAVPADSSLDALRGEVEAVKSRILALSAQEAPVFAPAAPRRGFVDVAGVQPVRHSRSPSRSRPVAKNTTSMQVPAAVRNVPAPASAGEVPLPALSNDLKESIHNLVRKVNTALASSEEAPTTAAIATPGNSRQLPIAAVAAPKLDTPMAQEGFMRALQAVQELRERNLSLREENAELAEELLAQDGLLTPTSMQGALPQWPPSQQHSACPTPGQHIGPSAQLVQPAAAPPQAQPVVASGQSAAPGVSASSGPAVVSGGARDRGASPQPHRSLLLTSSAGSAPPQANAAFDGAAAVPQQRGQSRFFVPPGGRGASTEVVAAPSVGGGVVQVGRPSAGVPSTGASYIRQQQRSFGVSATRQ